MERDPKNSAIREYVNRILNKLSPMLYVMGDVFACEDDFIHQLTERRVVFRTDMLNGPILNYVTSGLLQWYTSYRMDNGLRGPLQHLLIVDECFSPCGIGAEVAMQVMERGFDDLDAPVRRLHGAHTPTPYSPPLENAVTPQTDEVVQAIRELMAE